MKKGRVILWNICLARKQRKSGAFQKGEYKNFARKNPQMGEEKIRKDKKSVVL